MTAFGARPVWCMRLVVCPSLQAYTTRVRNVSGGADAAACASLTSPLSGVIDALGRIRRRSLAPSDGGQARPAALKEQNDVGGEGGARVAADVEVILMKQVASYLAMPIFVVDPVGTLIFYNEPAEELLGQRYDETGDMPLEEWATVFLPTDADGVPLPPGDLPLAVALAERRPAHGQISITGLDGQRRRLAVTAFPLVGQHERELGAVALFWEDAT